MGFYQAQKIEKLEARIAELEKARDEALAFIKKQTDDKITLYDAQYHMRERIAALEAAINLFIAYDNTDDEDGVAMMTRYDAAIEAARAAREGKND